MVDCLLTNKGILFRLNKEESDGENNLHETERFIHTAILYPKRSVKKRNNTK